MNINIDININIKASEDITNCLLTLVAVLHNAVPIFNENPKVIQPKEELNIDNKELQVAKAKLEVSCQVVSKHKLSVYVTSPEVVVKTGSFYFVLLVVGTGAQAVFQIAATLSEVQTINKVYSK